MVGGAFREGLANVHGALRFGDLRHHGAGAQDPAQQIQVGRQERCDHERVELPFPVGGRHLIAGHFAEELENLLGGEHIGEDHDLGRLFLLDPVGQVLIDDRRGASRLEGRAQLIQGGTGILAEQVQADQFVGLEFAADFRLILHLNRVGGGQVGQVEKPGNPVPGNV